LRALIDGRCAREAIIAIRNRWTDEGAAIDLDDCGHQRPRDPLGAIRGKKRDELFTKGTEHSLAVWARGCYSEGIVARLEAALFEVEKNRIPRCAAAAKLNHYASAMHIESCCGHPWQLAKLCTMPRCSPQIAFERRNLQAEPGRQLVSDANGLAVGCAHGSRTYHSSVKVR
jgi:hypothetical protein